MILLQMIYQCFDARANATCFIVFCNNKTMRMNCAIGLLALVSEEGMIHRLGLNRVGLIAHKDGI